MKITYLLFSISFIVISIIQAMEKSFESTIQTKNKKIITLTHEETCHSSYISECNRLISRNYSKKVTIQYDVIEFIIKRKQLERAILSRRLSVYDIKKNSINITSQEIKFFKKIIHQSSLYDQIKHKEYIQALTIAEKLKAPLLYAELLQARLPFQVLALITEKYKALSYLNNSINDKVSEVLINRWEKIKYTFLQRCDQLETAESTIKDLLKNMTLSQAVIIDMIYNATSLNNYPMKIITHMPGYNTLVAWDKHDREFILRYFPIDIIVSTTQKKGLNNIISFNFKV